MKKGIKVYDSFEGLRDITYNSLDAKGGLLIFETSYSSLNKIFSLEEAEEIRKEFVRRDIKIRELTNKAYHKKYTEISYFHEKFMNIRYINPKFLSIKIETLIYNDVVAIYDPKGNGICVEIRNSELVKQQKQLFEFVWNKAERPIIGNGRSSIF